MKTKTITLRIAVTTEDGEVLETAQVVSELDLDSPLDKGGNAKRLASSRSEAASVFEDALRVAFTRAKKAKG